MIFLLEIAKKSCNLFLCRICLCGFTKTLKICAVILLMLLSFEHTRGELELLPFRVLDLMLICRRFGITDLMLIYVLTSVNIAYFAFFVQFN